jgi:hypothetical protein
MNETIKFAVTLLLGVSAVGTGMLIARAAIRRRQWNAHFRKLREEADISVEIASRNRAFPKNGKYHTITK